ncbi:MFS transporter [Microbacterium luticocti]|uniref:MFS transporter n=1 Tax=Microbacterium luticocti TaxID=451764 RepID=UPI000421E0A0|nr:MFS transporter [Microbacterium luticocti]
MGNDAPDAAAPEAAASPSPGVPRLGVAVIVRYAIGSIGTGGFATLPGLVLTYYLTDSLGVAAIMAGVVITAAKIWDVIIDPVVGALSDRDRARHGTRRRFMLIGACSIPLFFALTFAAPPALGPILGAVWVLIAFLLTATAFSLFQVPYIALPAELTAGYDERTRLLTWRVVALTLAILLFGAGGPVLRDVSADPILGYLVMGIVSGVVLGLGMLVATTVARHAAAATGGQVRPAAAGTDAMPRVTAGGAPGIRAHYAAGIAALRRSAPFRTLLSAYLLQALATGLMLAGAQYVATWVLHSEAAVTLLFVALIAPAFLAAPLWGLVSNRWGKERTFAAASVLFALAALALFGLQFAPGDWAYVPVALAGVGYAGMQSLPMAMLPDVISHDEHAHGPGRAGAFSGVWTAGETVGFALGAAVLSITLAVTGYVSSTVGMAVTQPDAAVTGIVVAFSILPAALIALSLLALARYRLRRTDIELTGTGSQPR